MYNATEKLIEQLSEKVHAAWMEEKRQQGFHSPAAHKGSSKFKQICAHCHTDMYPYNELPENIKEYYRKAVIVVLQAISDIGIKAFY